MKDRFDGLFCSPGFVGMGISIYCIHSDDGSSDDMHAQRSRAEQLLQNNHPRTCLNCRALARCHNPGARSQ